jgi:hypothetical protein
MTKVLLYNEKIFLNARSFYEFILINEMEGETPANWDLGYIAVAFSYKLKTISGLKVEWVSIRDDVLDALRSTEGGWMEWKDGPDITFVEYVKNKETEFTREELWNWVVEYVTTYDQPRAWMKRFVDEVMSQSESIEKKNRVLVYKLTKDQKE